MGELNRVVEEFDTANGLIDALISCVNLGLADVTVTTVVTPKFEHIPERIAYHLDASKPAGGSRALRSTRTA